MTHSNSNIYHSSNQTGGGNEFSSSGRNNGDNSPTKRNDGGVGTSSSTNNSSSSTDLLPSLLTMYLHTFLQGAVRSSLQCPGEQSSLAAFRATKVLLSELQKSSRNGTLLLLTTRFLCDNDSVDVGVRENIVASSSSSSLLTPKKSEINGADKSRSKTDYEMYDHKNGNIENKIDLISTIISKGKSKNKHLCVASTVLLSTILQTSNIDNAINMLSRNRNKNNKNYLTSVESSPNVTISVDNSPNITIESDIMSSSGSQNNLEHDLTRLLASKSLTLNKDDNNNNNNDSNNIDIDRCIDSSLNSTQIKNIDKNKSDSNCDSNLNPEVNGNEGPDPDLQDMKHESVENKLLRSCKEIYESNEIFVNIDNEIILFRFDDDNKISKMSPKQNRNTDLNGNENSANKSENLDESRKMFFDRYVDSAAVSIVRRLSGKLSSLLRINKETDRENGKRKSEYGTGHNTNNSVLFSSLSNSSNSDDNKSENQNGKMSSLQSVVLDFVTKKLSNFLSSKYDEQIALTGLVRHCLCLLCSLIVASSTEECSSEKKRAKTVLEEDRSDLLQDNEKEKIYLTILNIFEIIVSLNTEMKNYLKNVVDAGEKVRTVRYMLSLSENSGREGDTLGLEVGLDLNRGRTDVDSSVTVQNKINSNPNSNISSSSGINISSNSKELKLSPMRNGTSINTDRNVNRNRNKEIELNINCNYNKVISESRQNIRILETSVVTVELLRETVGVIMAMDKLKFSLNSAYDYGKSINILPKNIHKPKMKIKIENTNNGIDSGNNENEEDNDDFSDGYDDDDEEVEEEDDDNINIKEMTLHDDGNSQENIDNDLNNSVDKNIPSSDSDELELKIDITGVNRYKLRNNKKYSDSVIKMKNNRDVDIDMENKENVFMSDYDCIHLELLNIYN